MSSSQAPTAAIGSESFYLKEEHHVENGTLLGTVTFVADGYWWLIYPAGIAIVLTVVAFNFIGDGLRDALEVRLQKR